MSGTHAKPSRPGRAVSALGALGVTPLVLILGPRWMRSPAPADPVTPAGVERPDLPAEPSVGELADRTGPHLDRYGDRPSLEVLATTDADALCEAVAAALLHRATAALALAGRGVRR